MEGVCSSVSLGRVLGFERSEPLSRAREFSGISPVSQPRCPTMSGLPPGVENSASLL